MIARTALPNILLPSTEAITLSAGRAGVPMVLGPGRDEDTSAYPFPHASVLRTKLRSQDENESRNVCPHKQGDNSSYRAIDCLVVGEAVQVKDK